MADLKPKDRMKIPRQDMPHQDPVTRAANFDEVATGLTLELAMLEAERCLQCKNSPCVEGCPVEVMIPEFILALRSGDLHGAALILKGEPTAYLVRSLFSFVKIFEKNYEKILPTWNGNLEFFKDAGQILDEIFS